MTTTIALAQSSFPKDGDVVGMARGYIEQAAHEGAQLVVFPEALMTRFEESIDDFVAQAQPIDGPFVHALSQAASEHGVWIVFTMNELNPEGMPFNTAVVVDSSGVVRGTYRKVHLFDAQGHRESERMAYGESLFNPIDSPIGKLGLAICYDLRFPEQARAAALDGAQVMVYPAAWVAGPGKVEQWIALLQARAIENGMYVLGCGSADEKRIGTSCVVAPNGELVACGPEGEEALLIADVDLDFVDAVRAATPSLNHRRPSLYATAGK